MTAAIQLFVLMVAFSVIESCWPSSRAHKWWRRPLLVDLCSWMVHPLSIGLGIAVAAALVNGLVAVLPEEGLWLAMAALRMNVAGWPLWLQIMAAFLIYDFLSYWIHRAYHRFPVLWAFHVVHHTSEELDWLSTSRLHPISQALDTAVVGFVLLLIGFPVAAVLASNIIIGAAALLVRGRLEKAEGVANVVAERIELLPIGRTLPSRDFR
jgi:sterol desaturase/sphingolipid hydroxylase (fatty acid hydroxylase superfamily)